MSHIHSVIDTDVHYKIDGITRTVVNIDETKRELVQGDHNSERFTFEIPRYVDGHDFLKCNVVQVHYENVDTYEKNVSKDIYNVDDLHIKSDDDKTIVLSWLIHGNATKYVGSLNFVIRFSCVTDGQVDYAWNTTEFKGISILKGLYNSETVNEQHSDAIANLVERIINLEGKAPDSAIGDLTWSDVGSEIQSDMILYNGTANFNDAGYHTITSPLSGLPVPISVVPGSTYKVTITPYNSSSYTPITGLIVCEYSFTPPDATKEKNYFFIGNAHIANADRFANTGEQFVIIVDPDNKPNEKGAYGWIYTNSAYFQKYPTTFRLSGKREIVTQLPKKYLPNDVGAISSWNDLKDKPFGEVEKEGYIIPETTLELSGGEGSLFEQPAALWANGRSYTVNWNGTDYNCIAAELDVTGEGNIGYLLGNMAAMGGDDTGEPFLIVGLNSFVDGVWGLAYDFAGAETATFSVYGLGVFTEKIEEKYIPNNARMFTVNISVDNGKMIADKTHSEIMQALCLGMNIRCLAVSKVFTEFVCDETHVEFIGTERTETVLRRVRFILDSNGAVTYSADEVSLGLRSRDGYHCIVNDEGLPIEFHAQTQDEAYSNITSRIAEGNPVYLLKYIEGSEIGSFIYMAADESLVFMRIEPTSDGTEMQMVLTFVRKPGAGYDHIFYTYKSTLSATAQ